MAKLTIESKQRLMKEGKVRLHFKQKAKKKKGTTDPEPIDVPHTVADKFDIGEDYDLKKLQPKPEGKEED